MQLRKETVRCPACLKCWTLEYVDQGGDDFETARLCVTCIHGCGVTPERLPPAVDRFAELVAQEDRAVAAAATNPVTARCPTCDHEWVVAFLPMPIERFAKLGKASRCPKGCTAGPRLGSMV